MWRLGDIDALTGRGCLQPREETGQRVVAHRQFETGPAVQTREDHRIGEERQLLLAFGVRRPATSIAERSRTRRGRGEYEKTRYHTMRSPL